MKFVLPKRVDVGGDSIKVSLVDTCKGYDNSTDGNALFTESKIEIRSDKGNSIDYTNYIFFHELTHHILNAMGEDRLKVNEKFVTAFGKYLYQAIKSMK
jgi:hypothetical protein